MVLRNGFWARSPRAEPASSGGRLCIGPSSLEGNKLARGRARRARTRAQLHHEAALDELPDGAFVLQNCAPHLVLDSELLSWTAAGYVARAPRPTRRQATVITPPSLVAVLRTGWEKRLVPLFHPSARHA